MPETEVRLDQIAKRLEADGVAYLLAQFVDIHGAPKVKLVPAHALGAVHETGAGFAGGAVWGMGQGAHSHDMYARIDLDSYTPLPYEPGVARFASDLHVDGEPHPFCPRVNLRRVLARARELGFTFNVGMEPEFFLVSRRPDGSITGWDPHGVDDLSKPCYDYKGLSGALGFLRAISDGLQALGWGVYQADHEDANDQFEINFQYADALVTADRLTFFRMMAGQVAQRFGATATFMAKPFAGRTGSGAHMHYHLADAKTGENLFHQDPAADPRGLGISPLGYRFLGGVLHHAPALCAIASPTVNCYKRLQVGAALTGSRSGFTWVPAWITYGDNNRTQMIRTPEPGHFEDRTVSSACNPYLTLAAYLAAGLDGMAHDRDPGPPNLGNLYDAAAATTLIERGVKILPQSLPEALDALEGDAVVLEALGPIAGEFLRLKRSEWLEYHAEVESWEIRRYLTAL
jgi:glutamine synthetase